MQRRIKEKGGEKLDTSIFKKIQFSVSEFSMTRSSDSASGFFWPWPLDKKIHG